jgi:ATP/ADP translocase
MKLSQIDPKIKILSVIYFMVAQSSMMARATSDSFLLKYFEAESIPLMIMAAASLSIILAILSTYLCERFQAYGAMRIATAGIIITLCILVPIVYLLGGKGETKPIYVFAYMLCETIVILPMVLFWGMAMGVLNPTESKRWMGLIGAAGTLGCILAGFTISFVSKQEFVNEISLAMNAAVLIVVSIILMIRAKMFTIGDDEDDVTSQQATYSIFKKLGVLISSKQSVLMTWLVVFSAIVLSLIDINFKFEVRKDYSDDLYDFFGQFYTYTSCVQLLLQLFIVRAILTRGGVISAISILPILILLVSVGALLVHSREAVYVGKFITQVVFFTIEYVGLQMLFLSVRKKLRGQMNSAVDGLTRPATIATISLLITYTLPFWQGGSESDAIYRLNFIIIGLCVCWLIVAFFNYRLYLFSLLGIVGGKISREPSKSSTTIEKTQFRKKLHELQNFSGSIEWEGGLKLANELILGCSPKQLSILEKLFKTFKSMDLKLEVEKAYFSHIVKSGILPQKISLSKNRADELIAELSSINSLISDLTAHRQYDEVCKSLIQYRDTKIDLLANVLCVFNSSINYTKIFRHILGTHVDLKSQSLEVLKGAVGVKRMDAVISVLEPPKKTNRTLAPIEALINLADLQDPGTLLSIITLINAESFPDFKNLLFKCLQSGPEEVRKLSLENLLRYEEDKEFILETCQKLIDDSNPEIASLASSGLTPSQTS